MTGENVARIIFGAGMSLHQLLTLFLPGIAFALMLVHVYAVFRPTHSVQAVARLITNIFTIHFCIAVASGITLETDLVRNWNNNGNLVADLVNLPVGRTAFFGYLAITGLLLLHYITGIFTKHAMGILAGFLLLFCTTLLSWWAVAVNTWMNVPDNYMTVNFTGNMAFVNGYSVELLFKNKFFLVRYFHILNSQLICGVALIYVVMLYLHKRYPQPVGLLNGVLISLLFLQAYLGSMQQTGLKREQPAKAAAFLGYYQGPYPPAIYVIGLTNEGTQRTIGLKIPTVVSQWLMAKDSALTPIAKLPVSQRPPVQATFHAYHLMLFCWLIAISLTLLLAFRHHRSSYISGMLTLAAVLWVVLVFAAMAGWLATEQGRQPWLVYNVIHRTDAFSGLNGFVHNALSFMAGIFVQLMLIIFLIYLCYAQLRSAYHKGEEYQ